MYNITEAGVKMKRRVPEVDPTVLRREEEKEKVRDTPRRGVQKVGQPRARCAGSRESISKGRSDHHHHRKRCLWARVDELSDDRALNGVR